MRSGDSFEDRMATQDYIFIQNVIYPIINQYETKGKYEFFIMLAGEMMHSAIKHGKAQGMTLNNVFSDFEAELQDHLNLHQKLQQFNKTLGITNDDSKKDGN